MVVEWGRTKVVRASSGRCGWGSIGRLWGRLWGSDLQIFCGFVVAESFAERVETLVWWGGCKKVVRGGGERYKIIFYHR